jgi:hypothetical protein
MYLGELRREIQGEVLSIKPIKPLLQMGKPFGKQEVGLGPNQCYRSLNLKLLERKSGSNIIDEPR